MIPDGPGSMPPRSRPGREAVPSTGTGRVWGTAAGMAPRLIHSTTPNRSMSSSIAAVSSRQR